MGKNIALLKEVKVKFIPHYRNFTLLSGPPESFEVEPYFVFALMPFGRNEEERRNFSEIYFRIKEVLKKNTFHGGILKCSRADKELGFNIMEDILNNIKKAGLTIFDISVPNLNVYYELGIACALDKKILLLFNENYYYINKNEELPFDIKQFRYIEYKSLSDLEARLKNTVESIINLRDYSNIDHEKIYEKLKKLTRHFGLDSKAEIIKEDYNLTDFEISKTMDVLDEYWNNPEYEKKGYKVVDYMEVETKIRKKLRTRDWQRVKMILKYLYWAGHNKQLIANLKNLPREFDNERRDFKKNEEE